MVSDSTMLLPLVALCVVFFSTPALSFSDACDANQPPLFCQGLNCPNFTLLCCDEEASKDFRKYDAAWWVRTEFVGGTLSEAGNQGFHLLFDYISGENEGNITIDMTSPVSNQIFYGKPHNQVRYIVSFYAPYIYQNEPGPPQPTNPAVYTEYLPERMVAVGDSSGYVGDEEERHQLGGLQHYCLAREIKFDPLFSWFNGYNAPFQPIHRHNEVMVDIMENPCPVVKV